MIKLQGGQSKKDRISFITTEDRSMTAIRKENGEIELQYEEKNKSFSQALVVVLLILIAVLVIKAWVIIPFIEQGKLAISWYLMPTLFYSFWAIVSIIAVRKELGIEGLRNHAAEHMVVTAYKRLKRVPTMEEVAGFSRISKVCGITIFSSFITAQLIGFAVYVQYGYRISEIIIFLISLLLYSKFPFNLLGKLAQFLTTSKPKKQNIELAIMALSSLEERERLREIVRECINNIFTK